MSGSIKAVVFDLGGVLLSLRNPIENFGLSIPEAEFLERWLMSPAVREFERGAIDGPAFARMIIREFELEMDWQRFLERFDAWPERLFPTTLELLDAIPATVGRVILSNTNALHWGRAEISGLLADRIDRAFLSFQTGFLKPDHEAFAQVAASYGCRPDEILFFDDNPLNVEAAARFGMQAFLAKGPDDALAIIRDSIARETGSYRAAPSSIRDL